MKQRVSVITLGVSDLARARRFYEALGWTTGAAPECFVAVVWDDADDDNNLDLGALGRVSQRIVDQVRQGASFLAYARQFSEASTAAVGGDLGWMRPEQLPAGDYIVSERLVVERKTGADLAASIALRL